MKKIVQTGLAVVFVLTLLTTACTKVIKTEEDFFPQVTEQKKEAEWTVMYFFNGDNSLGDFMVNSIDDIEREGASDDVNAVILFDTHERRSIIPEFIGFYSKEKTALIEITKKKTEETHMFNHEYNAEIVNTSPKEIDMGSPETLEEFLEYCLKRAPSKKTMLVIFTHGRGTVTIGGRKTGNSLSPDWTDQSSLSIGEAKSAIKKAIDSQNNGKKLDVLIMASCLNNQLGINYAFKDLAEVIVSSPDVIEISPRLSYPSNRHITFPFPEMMAKIKANPGMTGEDIAKYFIDKMSDTYSKSSNIPLSLSRINTSKMETLIRYFNEFSDALMKRLQDKKTRSQTVKEIYRIISSVDEIKRGYPYYDMYDLIEKISQSSDDPEIKKTGLRVIEYLEKEVIAYQRHDYHINGNSSERSRYLENHTHGMGIYFPSLLVDFSGLIQYNRRFKESDLAKDTSWDEVIDILLNEY